MKLSKTLRMPDGTDIPVGTELHFSNEGLGYFDGKEISIYNIPTCAIEGVEALTVQHEEEGSETKSVLATEAMVNGLMIPAGTELTFDSEGNTEYAGESFSVYDIPSSVFGTEAIINNEIDPDKAVKAFKALKPGDAATDCFGQPVRITGKAIGEKGFNALVKQFGNNSCLSFDDLTANLDSKDHKFVSYTNSENEPCVGLFGPDDVYVPANA